MSAINDGGPAFAAPGMPAYSHDGAPLNPWDGHGWAHDPQPGMSLRDWFAGMALQGQLSVVELHKAVASDALTSHEVAGSCYEYADAMIAARERKEDA